MSREMLDMVDVLAREKNVEKSAVFGEEGSVSR